MYKPQRRKTAKAILREARRVCESDAWWQGSVSNATGTQFCAIGAISKVGLGDPYCLRSGETLRAFRRLRDVCRRLYDGRSVGITNDVLGRAAVLKAFDKAIEGMP